MTIQDVIDRMHRRKDDRIEDGDIIRYVNEIEWKIYREVILTHSPVADKDRRHHCHRRYDDPLDLGYRHHHHHVPYPEFNGLTADDRDKTLFAPAPYDELYIYFVRYKRDAENDSTVSLKNTEALFLNKYQEYQNYINENYMPNETAHIHERGYGV